jgi:hypothetical protein
MDRPGSYPEGSVYKIDFFALLLCMAVAHAIIGNPFFGASVYLFADIVKAFFLCNLARLRHRDGANYFSSLVLALVFIGGMAVAFLYPPLMNQPKANYVSLFALSLLLRDYLCAVPLGEKRPRGGRWPFLLLVQICFDAFCAFMIAGRVGRDEFIVMTALVVLTGALRIFYPELHISTDSGYLHNRYEALASYRVFEDMNLYSTIALNLGVMVFFLFILSPQVTEFRPRIYGALAVWLLAIYAVLFLSSIFIRKRMAGLALAEFILGAVTWCLGAVFMFRSARLLSRMAWTVIWGIGMALISSAIRKFHLDFEAVGSIAEGGLDRTELEISNTIAATVASIISSVVMLLLMAFWTYIVPLVHRPIDFGGWMLQLPLLFMLVAIFFACRQPLDYRNREKLMRFIEARSKTEQMRDNLQGLFVRKYRMRFGVKILCTLARPFLHLRVAGREHLRREDYPSVFVCNHGFIYGPISAVIYLPTYFRPWVHNVMLDPDTAFREMSKSLAFIKKALGKRLGGRAIRQLTRAVCWALNSCNPIPVVRGASRDVMATFNESLKALEDGDNILIFPEKPRNLLKAVPDADYNPDNVRSFYTGFAHIGKMYYDRCGKSLLFYPLFSDRDSHSFRIGKPVLYDPGLEPHESKRRLAEQLQERMAELESAGKRG